MTEPINPFATPQSEETLPGPPPLGLHDGMPASVKLAIGCLAVFACLLTYDVVRLWQLGVRSQPVFLWEWLPVALAALLLFGLVRRNRFARLWARVVTCLGAAALTVWLFAFIYLAWMGGMVMQDSVLGIEMPVWWVLIVQPALIVGVSLTLWIPFFALGRRSAIRYFEIGRWRGGEEFGGRVE